MLLHFFLLVDMNRYKTESLTGTTNYISWKNCQCSNKWHMNLMACHGNSDNREKGRLFTPPSCDMKQILQHQLYHFLHLHHLSITASSPSHTTSAFLHLLHLSFSPPPPLFPVSHHACTTKPLHHPPHRWHLTYYVRLASTPRTVQTKQDWK